MARVVEIQDPGTLSGERHLALQRALEEGGILHFPRSPIAEEDRGFLLGLRQEFRFPSGSSWMVYTDTVGHAVLSGRSALEQTLRIGRRSLAEPDRAPIAVLEKLAGRALA